MRDDGSRTPGTDKVEFEPWVRLSERVVHATPFLTLREDRVRLPTGQTIAYGVVACGHCVGVLPFIDRDHVVMVRQWRYIAGKATWEMPTGGVHTGETPEFAAQRELAEEAGYRAGRLVPLGAYHTSKSSLDETAHLYLGEDLVPAVAISDPTEDTRPIAVPFADVLAMVLDGTITDSMTIIAVLRAARLRGV